jgi:DNA-binding NtrC family response regulator
MPHMDRDTTIDDHAKSGRREAVRAEPYLFLAMEAARPNAGGARHGLASIDEAILGRAPARTASRTVENGVRKLFLGVPDGRISKLHARVRRVGDGFVIEDLGSKNGSRVQGSPLSGPMTLHDGDVIEVGHTFLVFRVAVTTRATDAVDVDAWDLPAGAPPGFATLAPDQAARLEALSKIARSAVPVLVLGETGTGKELLARGVHRLSGRAGRFVGVNAGALPAALVEAQLFGHVRGAFTGATSDERGFVRAADGGTLFLDEIADLTLSSQAALLRVLNEQEVTPVGASRSIDVDVRVVAATHADLVQRCREGTFREDLWSRLCGYTHIAPPLRERREDLGVICASLLRDLPDGASFSISVEAARALFGYDWPRNIRELRHALSAGVTLTLPDHLVDVIHLPPPVAACADATASLSECAAGAQEDPDAELRRRTVALPAERGPAQGKALRPAAKPLSLESLSLQQRIVASLSEHGGNVTHVGKALGTSRSQVQRWLKRFALDPRAFRR